MLLDELPEVVPNADSRFWKSDVKPPTLLESVDELVVLVVDVVLLELEVNESARSEIWDARSPPPPPPCR